MRRRTGYLAACTTLAVLIMTWCAGAADPSPDDALKAKGLTKVGAYYLLDGDIKNPEGLAAMRQAKKRIDDYNRQKTLIQREIDATDANIERMDQEYRDLRVELGKWKDVYHHNKLAAQINSRVALIKDAEGHKAKVEAEMHKLVDPTDGYVGALIEQAAKMETTSARYEALAADPQVAAALAKVNEKAWPKVKLGPSPAFATEFPPVRKLRSAYNTEVVKFTLEGGVPHVSVMLNGLVSTPMVFDSGASIVLLPYDIATRAGLSPGRGERKIPLTIANGKSVEATVMTLDSVRVGQFTVQNVECAVLPKSSGSAEGLLGGTFLRHFSTRLDLGAHELHLSQVDAPADGRKTPASKPTAKPATQPAR